MEIQGYFTQRGNQLSAKLASGATLEITRVAASDGATKEPAAATALPQIRQTLAVNTPISKGNTATIPVTLTAALANEAYTLTELGIFARDPDEGEILYKLYKLSEPVEISPDSRLVLRFYLEETVSQDLGVTVDCSPDGLVTEEVFSPIQTKVMAKTVKMQVVHLDVCELQAYLDKLPRLLTEVLIIVVSGELDTALDISDFYGSGYIQIQADDTAGCTLRQAVRIANCALPVYLKNLNLIAPAGIPGNTGLCVVNHCRYVFLQNCTLTGHEHETRVYGVEAEENSRVVCESSSISGFYGAIFSGRLCSALVNGEADDYSDNTYGAYVWMGGTVMLAGAVSDTLGGSTNLKSGGMIVKSDGTLL